MENCLFVANLPQTLNNYELTIALYLVFSRYGKVVVVKASRDSAHRPFGFVEFSNIDGCREALRDNDTNGIVIGGRRVRLEMARNTSKLYVKLPDYESLNILQSLTKFKPISIPNDENAFLIKLNGANVNLQEVANQLTSEHPDWIIQIRNDQITNSLFGVAESAQRQSGLFQLRVPESGVLPVSPATLAKIHSFSPCLQYSLTPLEPSPLVPLANLVPLVTSNQFMNRLYEDWHESGLEESFQDPSEARIAATSKLNPPLGEWEGDVFFGRLDNQKVTIKCLIDHCTTKYGEISFLRLCNRSIIREDRVPVDSTAFVRFKSPESAKKCIELENGSTWMGRIIKCEKCWNFLLGRNTPPISLETDTK